MKTYAGVKVQLHLSWIQHKVDVNGQLHAPATLFQVKQLTVTFAQDTGWTSEAVWTLWGANPLHAGNWTPGFQPVARRYTDLVSPLKEMNRPQQFQYNNNNNNFSLHFSTYVYLIRIIIRIKVIIILTNKLRHSVLCEIGTKLVNII
jgi:hypothetical protein